MLRVSSVLVGLALSWLAQGDPIVGRVETIKGGMEASQIAMGGLHIPELDSKYSN